MTRARRRSALLALGVAAWLGAGATVAQEAEEALRPCRRADLIGAWEVVRFGTAPPVRVDRNDPYFYPHQRYVFRTDATLRHLASTKAITPDDHWAMLAAPATITWAVDERGRLLTQKDGVPRLEISACEVLVKEVADPRSRIPALPGDLLLTHYDENAKPISRRQLRKLGGIGE